MKYTGSNHVNSFTCGRALPRRLPGAGANVHRIGRTGRAGKSGQTFTLTQSGNSIDLKNERGEQGHANLTSPMTISAGAPFNMLGVIRDGGIDWSNGTRWRKQ